MTEWHAIEPMSSNRRRFVQAAVGCFAASALAFSPPFFGAGALKIKAVLFDAFPIFDPRPIFMLVDELFPVKGSELSELWRNRQFEYTWLRSMSQHYEDFWHVTEEALVFAAAALKLDLPTEKRDRLMNAYLSLKAWPDVPPVLQALKKAGIRIGFLSNFTPRMLDACIKNSGLEAQFDHVLSTDSVRTYKPAPQAYQMGLDVFRTRREETAFVAFAGWDAAGAKWFGYPTFWANRRRQSATEMGIQPDATGEDLTGLTSFVGI